MLSPSHELTGLEVGGHGLVVFTVQREGVTIGEPCGAEDAVEIRGLAQVPAGVLLLVHQIVIRAHGKPGP